MVYPADLLQHTSQVGGRVTLHDTVSVPSHSSIPTASQFPMVLQAGDMQTMEAQLEHANLGATASPAMANPSPAAAGSFMGLPVCHGSLCCSVLTGQRAPILML